MYGLNKRIFKYSISHIQMSNIFLLPSGTLKTKSKVPIFSHFSNFFFRGECDTQLSKVFENMKYY